MLRKWLFPLACIAMIIISMLPLYTAIPYDFQNTQDVILSVLKVSLQPYQHWGWVFHAATVLLIAYIFWKPDQAGRVMAGYMGINYLIVAVIQSHAVTEKYGYVLLTGAMLGTAVLGIIWLLVAARNSLNLSLANIPRWRYFLFPLALLVFWSPVKMVGEAVVPNFDPRLLFTSADYGLAYCFVTPVFLFLLILFSTDHTSFAFRISAFNAFLYGLFNQMHWFNANSLWMGAMHLPLLVISLIALLLPYLERAHALKPALRPK